jgi:8-oxo-dGTP diphosphatase
MLVRPILAVDVVLLRIESRQLEVLLSARQAEPFRGRLALPGVAMLAEETLESAARRTLQEKGGLAELELEPIHLEQLAAFDALFRDPRGRTVSVAYLGLSRALGAAASPSRWCRVRELPRGSLPFDHDGILETAVARLRGKLRYTRIAACLLPTEFRIDELQTLYEAILDRRLNRANFRTKLLKIGLIERSGVLSGAVGPRGGRPPHLYTFARSVEQVERDFL